MISLANSRLYAIYCLSFCWLVRLLVCLLMPTKWRGCTPFRLFEVEKFLIRYVKKGGIGPLDNSPLKKLVEGAGLCFRELKRFDCDRNISQWLDIFYYSHPAPPHTSIPNRVQVFGHPRLNLYVIFMWTIGV